MLYLLKQCYTVVVLLTSSKQLIHFNLSFEYSILAPKVK